MGTANSRRTRREKQARPDQVGLLATVLLHAENLDHPDKDVDKVKLEADRLGEWVTLGVTGSHHLSVLQDALGVVEDESAKDGQTTVEREGLGGSQGAEGGARQDHGCERRKSDDGDTGEQRTAHPKELVLLSSGTDVAERADETSGVESSAREDGRVEEEQGAEHGGLGNVEEQPRRHLERVTRRKRGSTDHTANAGHQTDAEHQPRVSHHDALRDTVAVKTDGGDTGEGETTGKIHEGTVQVAGLDGMQRVAGFTVEEHVGTESGCTNDSKTGQSASPTAGLGEAGGSVSSGCGVWSCKGETTSLATASVVGTERAGADTSNLMLNITKRGGRRR